jgi:outer membrane protein TolC
VVKARLALCDTPAQRIDVLTHYLGLMTDFWELTQKRHEAGRVPVAEVHRARFQQLDAQVMLLEEKRAAEKAKAK